MKYTVTKEPMAMLEIELARDEQITAEAWVYGVHER